MTKEQIIEFLKENLEVRVHIDSEYEWDLGTHIPKGVRVALYLGGEEINSDHDSA